MRESRRALANMLAKVSACGTNPALADADFGLVWHWLRRQCGGPLFGTGPHRWWSM